MKSKIQAFSLILGLGLTLFKYARRMEWRHFEFLVSDVKQVKVRNCENDAKEELDLKDRVIKLSAGFGYLIVITPNQCYIYSVKNFNTPAIAELKEANVTLIIQSEK